MFTAGSVKLALVAGIGLVASLAQAQPVNDNFASATIITGASGTTNGSNVGSTLEAPCETNSLIDPTYGPDSVTNSVWYAWTATDSGTVTLDTLGSDFDTVLSVWTTTNGLCGGSLTNLAVNDDDIAGGNAPQSVLTFTAVAGTTYYFCVEGWAGATPPTGNFLLNWTMATVVPPTIRSGDFTFTSAAYYVSDLDSSAPISQDGGTVSQSVLGARVTVTRTNGSSGRVLVDFYTVNETYTNTFLTNYYGTNVSITFTDTNGVTSTTNTSENFIVYTNYFQSFIYGNYVTYPVWGALTNFVTTIYGQISSNTLYGTTFPLVQGALTPIPTKFPAFTNYFTGVTNRIAGVATNITLNNIFSYATTNDIYGSGGGNGTSFTNNSVVYGNYTNLWVHEAVTNFYGSNTFISSLLLGGAQLYTNYFRTNFVVSFLNLTNSYYTNGALITNQLLYTTSSLGRTNFVWSSSNNAANYNSFSSGLGILDPVPTNLPPIGTFSLGVTNSVDANSNITITASSVYRYLPVPVLQIIPASGAFGVVSNTLFFDDYEMSKDVLVPVSQVRSPDGNVLPYISSVITVKLQNIRLDDLETPDLITPTISGDHSSRINAYASQYSGSSSAYKQPASVGTFCFERSTFRVDKDESGGVAIISVYRIGGDPTASVTVDYVMDPTPGLNGGGDPPSTFTGGFGPANTFPLQAGSDYANPNSDYTPVSGTLSWGAYDYNPKSITIPILNNGLVENNADMWIQLFNPLPKPSGTTPGVEVGLLNYATLTELFDDRTCTQQPAGAVDRCWNKDVVSESVPPFLNYPGTDGGVSGSSTGNGGTVYAVAEQPDGKAIVAGSFISFDSNPYNRIVRLLANGYQDTTFLAAPNSGANDFIAALAVQPDGKILIAGKFTSFNGANRYHVARLNTDGSVDGTFMNGTLGTGLGVRGTNAMVWSMSLQTNGQVVIAGYFTSVNGTNCNSIARLNADGSLDLSFNPGVGPTKVVDGKVVAATVNSVVVDPLGRVNIGGEFEHVAGILRGGVARLNVDGTVDPAFDPGIGTYNADTGFTDPIFAMALQDDGKLLIGGAISYYELASYNGLLRLNADGSVDPSFNPGTGTFNPVTFVADSVTAITLQPDGTILIGGDFTTYNQTRRLGIARLFDYGSLDTSFMDTYYNQFAGLIPHYHNPDAVNTALYPQGNHRNFVNAIAVEPGTTNVIIGGGFLRVGGGSTRKDIHPRSNVARLIGGGTPGPGNMSLSYNKYTVDKSAGTLFVSLVRTNGNLGPASVTFSTNTAAPGPGIATGDDFAIQPVYTAPIWPTLWSASPSYEWMISPAFDGPNYRTLPTRLPPNNSPYVYLNINNTTNISGNKNANLAVSKPDGSSFLLGGEKIPLEPALGWQDASAMTIIDDNYKPGVLSFSAPTYVVNQNGGVATITITRTNFTGGVVQVSYVTVNGSATNGIDYTNATGTLTFQNSDSIKTFTIPIIKGTTAQPDKTVNLWIYTPAGGATLGLTNAVLTIVNNNGKNGHLGFVSGTNNVNETDGTALIGISRLGQAQGSLSVTVITSDGTATNGLNYVGTSTNISWANGEVVTKFVSIPVKHDGVFTPDLTVNLRLTNGVLNSVTNNAVVLGFGGTNTVLNIVNADFPGTVEFSSAAYSVKKYGGFALIPVVRSGGNAGTVAVNYTTVDNTALAGVNYTTSAGLLTFTNGEVTKYFNVPIAAGASNGLVALNLSLSNAVVVGNATPWNAQGNPSNAVLNIINTTLSDPQGVNETPGSPDVTYNDFAGFNDAVFALALQPDNQLLVGGDFTMANGVRRQHLARLDANGGLDAAFSLPITTMGADGSVRAIAIQSDGRILVGGYFTNLNSVVMNRIARLNHDGSLDSLFNPGSGADNPVYAVAETFVGSDRKILAAGDFTLLNGEIVNGIGRLNDDGTPDTTFNVGGLGANSTVYALAVQSDGKLLIGGDFTAVNGIPANHVARLNANGSVDLTFTNATANDSVRAITIQLDGQILLGGLFTSVNGNPYFNHIARLNSANGSTDTTFNPGLGADAAVLSIAVQTDSRIVVGGLFTHCSGVTRNRITRLNPDGTVDPTINFGVGADSFVGAVVVQEATITGYPTNVPNEKIIIGGGFTHYFGESHEHLARIYGGSIGGSGEFEFSSANYGANENGTNALITVNRTGGTSGTNANGLGNIYVAFATTDGTAKADTDHASVTNYFTVLTNLVFAAGEVQRTIVIPVQDDLVVNGDLTVNLALTPVAPGERGNQPTALLTITNVDSAISFSAATYLVTKYGANVPDGYAPITINRSGATYGTSTVVFNTTSNGTAVVGVDYQPVTNGVITFAPGSAVQTVMVPIINGISDGDRTVSLQLTNATGSMMNNPSNALLTILDRTQSKGSFELSATNYVVSEGGGIGSTNLTVTVLRTNGAAGIVSVGYATANGTAVAGAKYFSTNGVLSFADGEMVKTFQVQVLNTATVEPTSYFFVQLTNASLGTSIFNPSNATVTILNTNVGIVFSLATNTFNETLPFATLNVLRYNNTVGTTTINYSTTNGSAVAGVNFVASSGTLTFNDGASQSVILVPLLYSTNATGDLQFTVGLSNPTPGVQLGNPSITTVILQDNDAGLSFTTNSVSVLKNAGNLVVTVVCSNTNVEPVAVTYNTADGAATNHATAGADYVTTSGTLIFSNGVSTQTFTVPIINNGAVSGNHVFTVSLSNPTGTGRLVPPTVQTVTIIDSNSGIRFSGANYTVLKTGGAALISVYRSDFTNTTSTVDFVATNGTAISGLNFVATNGTLVFTNGQTVATFSVPIIATTTVQPDLTVLLELNNAVNGVLLSPSAAKLTIHDNTGSYVIAAGAQLLSETNAGAANGIIDPNETVTVLFGLRDAGGTNVNNLNATLLATNGVTPINPVTANYGTLVYAGHSVSRPFTFTASGTNNQQIAATFKLQDGANNIGTAIFGFTLGTWTKKFANTNAIIINDNTNATPYPALINVSGVGGSLVKATVTLTNLSHTAPADIGALVVGPNGSNTLIMANAGGTFTVSHVTLTFDDAAATNLPTAGQIISGTNKPSGNLPVKSFP